MTPHFKSYHNLINSAIRTSGGGGGRSTATATLHCSIYDLMLEYVVVSLVSAHTRTHMNIGVLFGERGVSCFIFEHSKDRLDTIIKAASEHRMTARVLDNQSHTVCISQSAIVLR